MEKIRVGFNVRGYMLEKLIGSGGFATVFRARNTGKGNYGHRIAVKILHERRLDRNQITKFRREAELAMKLSHENVVNVFEYFEEDGYWFIFMELLYMNYRQLIEEEKGLLKENRSMFLYEILDESLDIIRQSAQGLNYIHENGIIHKDFNPSNILISYNLDRVKITDFGLAKKNPGFTIRTLSAIGLKFGRKGIKQAGTIDYVAPEEKTGQYDKRVDIYSFGKTVQFTFDTIGLHKNSHIEKIIALCTHPDPEQRFPDMSLVLHELLKIQQQDF